LHRLQLIEIALTHRQGTQRARAIAYTAYRRDRVDQGPRAHRPQ